jgi:hypothetical protein
VNTERHGFRVDRVYSKDARQAAVDYRERGWAPIPLKMRSKAPKLPKGHPYLGRKATDEEFALFDFRHNVGIVTGKVSGIIVLDDDDGGETLHKNGWHVPPTPTVKTRRGHQYYFRCPGAGFPTFDVVPGNLEVRAALMEDAQGAASATDDDAKRLYTGRRAVLRRYIGRLAALSDEAAGISADPPTLQQAEELLHA